MNGKTRILAALLAAFLTAGSTAAFATNTTGTSTASDVEQTADSTAPADTTQTPPSNNLDEVDSGIDQTGMPYINVNAQASLVVNGETGEIVHADNETNKQYPASCTKIMTALVVLEDEKTKLDDVVTMTDDDLKDVINGASNAGLKSGEEITVQDLLYCLMLPSANEAANALARYCAGSVEAFANMMNQKAAALGCKNSHFVNPNGLHDDNHYTCAYDLYVIAKEAMKNETFEEIVNTAQKKLAATNMHDERIIYSTNELILSRYSDIYYDYCYGIKTGHTSEAGYCLVSFAKKSSYTYYSVVMGCTKNSGDSYAGSFTETKKLFQWAFDNFSMKTATNAGDVIKECPVRLGKGKDSVTLATADNITVLLPANVDASELDVKLEVQDSYDAPIAKGSVLGTVTYSYNGKTCASANLVALTDVERSQILYLFDRIGAFFASGVFRFLFVLIILAALVYIVLNAIAQRNRRRKQAKKNRRRRK